MWFRNELFFVSRGITVYTYFRPLKMWEPLGWRETTVRNITTRCVMTQKSEVRTCFSITDSRLAVQLQREADSWLLNFSMLWRCPLLELWPRGVLGSSLNLQSVQNIRCSSPAFQSYIARPLHFSWSLPPSILAAKRTAVQFCGSLWRFHFIEADISFLTLWSLTTLIVVVPHR